MTGMQHWELTVGSFLDHAARWHADTDVVTATENGQVRVGYAGFRARAGRLSMGLARLGVGRGNTVATLGWNTQGHLEAWYALAGLGAVCHTLNPRLAVDQLVKMVRQSKPRLLLFGTSLDDLAHTVGAALDIPLLSLDNAAGIARLIEEADEEAPRRVESENDPVGLCFTSGTTGAPKGVLYTHRSNHLHTLRLLQADALGLCARDRVLAVVPMFHANGWGLPFAAPAAGAALILPGRYLDGPSLARLIVEEGVTVAAGVPTVWLDLAAHVERKGLPLPTLERVYLGGAAMPVEAQRRLERLFGASVHTSWRMTELSPLGTIAAGGVDETPVGSSGRPPVGLDMRLVDRSGATIPNHETGEGRLKVRGPSVVRRYLDAATDAVDAEGWFDTGDLARVDAGGDLTITGRAKNLIKSGVEWINPVTIETLVGALPGIALAAVVGHPHPRWGERPTLFIELRPGATVTDAEISALLDGEIARWWLPDRIVRIRSMPLAPTGKIDKAALRTRRTEGVQLASA